MDKFFNHEFAKRTRELIEKMDDDSAEMFVRFSMYDVYQEDFENNKRTITSHADEICKSLAEEISKSLISRGDEDAFKAAQLVSVVSKKKTPFEERYGRPQNRDKSGKWTLSFSREKANNKYVHAVPHGQEAPGFDVTSALSTVGHKTSRFQEAWNGKDDEDLGSNSRTYRRIGAGAELLGHIPSTKAKLAGQVGEFVGSYGPEAEKVVGPHMRRTAYRYRGTERTPDKDLIAAQRNSALQVARNHGVDSRSADFSTSMRTQASQMAAVGYLESRLPKKGLSELQRKSGRIPPSEGIIINGDGKIITQAVGHADDHYLPFNLKNLKGLQGGHYVRSRSSGGLTTEDIYTGLVSGARSVTVVSRSGVFTMEFEDDFRGARRYNDKAAAMVGRYAKTLDAVKSEQVAVAGRGPSLEDKAEIRDEVEGEMGGWADRAVIENEVKRRMEDLKTSNLPTKSELAAIDAKVADLPDDRKRKMERAELIDNLMESKAASKYRLDGEGYEVALQALKEQYPYYIANVSAITYRNGVPDDPRFKSKEVDSGYVKPRHIRPHAALEGYYDTSIRGENQHSAALKGTGKINADQTHYQNWAHNPQNHRPAKAEESAEGGEKVKEEKEKKTAPNSPQQQMNANKRAAASMKAQQDAVHQLVNIYAPAASDKEGVSYPLVLEAKKALDTEGVIRWPETKMNDLMGKLGEMHDLARQGTPAHQRMAEQAEPYFGAHRTANSMLSGSEFDEEARSANPMSSPRDPHSFEQYQAGLAGSQYASMGEGLLKRFRLNEQGLSLDSSDADLRRASINAGAKAAILRGDVKSAEALAAMADLPEHQQNQIFSVANLPDTPQTQDVKQRLVQQALAEAGAIERVRRLAVLKKSAQGAHEAKALDNPNVVSGTVVDRGLQGIATPTQRMSPPKPAVDELQEHAEYFHNQGETKLSLTVADLVVAMESGDKEEADQHMRTLTTYAHHANSQRTREKANDALKLAREVYKETEWNDWGTD